MVDLIPYFLGFLKQVLVLYRIKIIQIWDFFNQGLYFLLPLIHSAQSLMGLNLVWSGKHTHMFGLTDDLRTPGRQPTFISIACHKACMFGSEWYLCRPSKLKEPKNIYMVNKFRSWKLWKKIRRFIDKFTKQ